MSAATLLRRLERLAASIADTEAQLDKLKARRAEAMRQAVAEGATTNAVAAATRLNRVTAHKIINDKPW